MAETIGWDADFYNSLPDETINVSLTRKQIYVLGNMLPMVSWSTRWSGDISGLDLDAIEGDAEFTLLDEIEAGTMSCVDVADCIETDEGVQSAITESIVNEGFAPNPETDLNTEPPPSLTPASSALNLLPSALVADCEANPQIAMGLARAIVSELHQSAEDFFELIEVDKVIAECTGIKSNCTIKRTENKIPGLFEGYFGPLIRTIGSIDGSEQVYVTTAKQFTKIANSKNFKYNKTKYYWISNDYVYFPNIEWDAVTIDGVFRDDISDYKCKDCEDSACKPAQDKSFNVPEYLYGELENFVIQEISGIYQIPPDPANDKQHFARG